jgi:hypothetical protein
MIWCIANQASYSSNFSIFALVGGFLLYRGGLKAARWCASALTFLLTACAMTLVVVPFIYPFGYWFAVLRHGNAMGILSVLVGAALFALLFWVRQQVLHPAVHEAQQAAELQPPRVKLPFALGVALALLVVTVFRLMTGGDTARKTIERAQLLHGPQYQYVVTSMQVSSNMKGKRVHAIVAAYNDREIKSISVNWED